MKLRFRLKNGKTHVFTLPDDAEVYRAIVWIPKNDKKNDKKEDMTRLIVIPHEVESVELSARARDKASYSSD
jgi:hypothetical protein